MTSAEKVKTLKEQIKKYEDEIETLSRVLSGMATDKLFDTARKRLEADIKILKERSTATQKLIDDHSKAQVEAIDSMLLHELPNYEKRFEKLKIDIRKSRDEYKKAGKTYSDYGRKVNELLDDSITAAYDYGKSSPESIVYSLTRVKEQKKILTDLYEKSEERDELINQLTSAEAELQKAVNKRASVLGIIGSKLKESDAFIIGAVTAATLGNPLVGFLLGAAKAAKNRVEAAHEQSQRVRADLLKDQRRSLLGGNTTDDSAYTTDKKGRRRLKPQSKGGQSTARERMGIVNLRADVVNVMGGKGKKAAAPKAPGGATAAPDTAPHETAGQKIATAKEGLLRKVLPAVKPDSKLGGMLKSVTMFMTSLKGMLAFFGTIAVVLLGIDGLIRGILKSSEWGASKIAGGLAGAMLPVLVGLTALFFSWPIVLLTAVAAVVAKYMGADKWIAKGTQWLIDGIQESWLMLEEWAAQGKLALADVWATVKDRFTWVGFKDRIEEIFLGFMLSISEMVLSSVKDLLPDATYQELRSKTVGSLGAKIALSQARQRKRTKAERTENKKEYDIGHAERVNEYQQLKGEQDQRAQVAAGITEGKPPAASTGGATGSWTEDALATPTGRERITETTTQPIASNTTNSAANMTVSPEGLNTIKSREGFRDKPYWDVNGWAIGYGSHTMPNGQPVSPGDTITEKAASQQLGDRLENEFTPGIKKNITAPLNQNQFDALASVGWNAGGGIWGKSDVVKAINKGDYEGAKNIIGGGKGYYNKSDNPVVRKRRQEEARQFAAATPTTVTTPTTRSPVLPEILPAPGRPEESYVNAVSENQTLASNAAATPPTVNVNIPQQQPTSTGGSGGASDASRKPARCNDPALQMARNSDYCGSNT